MNRLNRDPRMNLPRIAMRSCLASYPFGETKSDVVMRPVNPRRVG